MSLKFTPEFQSNCNVNGDLHWTEAASIFDAWLEAQIQVWTVETDENKHPMDKHTFWNQHRMTEARRTARLCNIEELVNAPCEHIPVHNKANAEWISAGQISPSYFPWECGKCGVKLKAKWEAV